MAGKKNLFSILLQSLYLLYKKQQESHFDALLSLTPNIPISVTGNSKYLTRITRI